MLTYVHTLTHTHTHINAYILYTYIPYILTYYAIFWRRASRQIHTTYVSIRQHTWRRASRQIHTIIYVSSHTARFILLYMCPHTLLYMCPHTKTATQFTCFTSTKAQILTRRDSRALASGADSYSVYLLY